MTAYGLLRERLDRGGTVVLDGGIGAELVRRGVRWRDNGMRTDGAVVQQIHEESIAAGADVIRTNTFQLNRRTYLNVFRDPDHMRRIGAPGLEARAAEMTRLAMSLARAAREQAGHVDVAIAGVLSPLEHCFRPDLTPKLDEARAEHAEVAGLLAETGADLLLLESMNTLAEARLAAAAARSTGLPVWVSFVVDGNANVLSGEPLTEAVLALTELGVDAILVNCAPPEDVARAIDVLARASPPVFGGYAHLGKFDPPSWKFEFFPQFSETGSWPPERYAAAVGEWRERGARIVGGCCGATPAHVAALAPSRRAGR